MYVHFSIFVALLITGFSPEHEERSGASQKTSKRSLWLFYTTSKENAKSTVVQRHFKQTWGESLLEMSILRLCVWVYVSNGWRALLCESMCCLIEQLRISSRSHWALKKSQYFQNEFSMANFKISCSLQFLSICQFSWYIHCKYLSVLP